MVVQMQGKAFEDALRYFRDSGEPFTVTRTGYTASIKTQGRKYLFADTPIRPQLFGLFSRLKKEVKQAGVPHVEERQVKYYSFQDIVKRRTLPRTAVCIDLTSAYVHALYQLRLISDPMFHELKALEKPERLKVVGMLATTNTEITYAAGRVQSVETRHSETRGAFFAACEAVGELMEHVSETPGHLFYWVDGAFFEQERPEVVEYFEAHGYPCKVEYIHDLKFSPSRRVLFYTKGHDRKYLCIPRKNPSPAWIAELLNTPRR